MNEFLFKYAEPSVSLNNVLLTITISIIVSVVIGIMVGSVLSSIRNGIISSLLFEVILVIMFFAVRDQVKQERVNVISSIMTRLSSTSAPCTAQNIYISNWREGLMYIESCPSEVGYYISTADILEDDKDYESAAMIIEIGLDIMQLDPPPPPLCERLRRYYRHLGNRPELDEKCTKIHNL